MEVIPVELRDAYAFGGGLHCCTADVYREGDLKDYFQNNKFNLGFLKINKFNNFFEFFIGYIFIT